MNSLNNNGTPGKENEFEENILTQKEFKANFNGKLLFINLIKTKDFILIRSSFYEMKLFQNNFGFITGNYMNNIDEAYNFLESIFMNNKFCIKSIVQSNLKLLYQMRNIYFCWSFTKSKRNRTRINRKFKTKLFIFNKGFIF